MINGRSVLQLTLPFVISNTPLVLQGICQETVMMMFTFPAEQKQEVKALLVERISLCQQLPHNNFPQEPWGTRRRLGQYVTLTE